ncbi:MAG TPA: hypothetical protein VG942_02685 [Hyphomonadaceae bacterium]|nr:hypothetical protein [Hyphomonadaceae bacterium]
MCATFPTCEPATTVFQRVAAELGAAAYDLSRVETHVAVLAENRVAPASVEQLQALDRIGQQLRVLEAFLVSASTCRCGRIDIDQALGEVWLEAVRKRLGGGHGMAAEAASAEPELW